MKCSIKMRIIFSMLWISLFAACEPEHVKDVIVISGSIDSSDKYFMMEVAKNEDIAFIVLQEGKSELQNLIQIRRWGPEGRRTDVSYREVGLGDCLDRGNVIFWNDGKCEVLEIDLDEFDRADAVKRIRSDGVTGYLEDIGSR